MPRNSTGDAAGDRAGEAPAAEGISYNPAVLTDWDSDADPGNVEGALDQLAERVDDNEGLIGSHLHDGDTLEHDGVNSNGGAFSFTTSGTVTFTQAIQIALDKKVMFGDTDVYIFSDDDGDADFIADGTITVAGTTETVIGVAGTTAIGDGNLRQFEPDTDVKVNLGSATKRFNEVWAAHLVAATDLRLLERNSDPTAPGEGQSVIWMSDGTQKGDDGDVLIASRVGGVTNWATLFDHSAGAGW